MSVREKADRPVTVVVFGLGRFGTALALALVEQGVEVLAVDEDLTLVERWADELTRVVAADSTDHQVLRQLGVSNFDSAVVAIGDNIEASVLTVLALAESGVTDIWAKAITRNHGRILERVGATTVVYPEFSMGEQVARMLAGGMLDYLELDDDNCIARTLAPEALWDKPLAESEPDRRYGITVVGIKLAGEEFAPAHPETVVRQDDHVVVSGPKLAVEKFCRLR